MHPFASDAARIARGDETALAQFRTGIGSFRRALQEWPFWADKRQLPPEGDWHGWLMLAGRGFGKTRAGAEWVHALAEEHGAIRIALVGATLDEARAISVIASGWRTIHSGRARHHVAGRGSARDWAGARHGQRDCRFRSARAAA